MKMFLIITWLLQTAVSHRALSQQVLHAVLHEALYDERDEIVLLLIEQYDGFHTWGEVDRLMRVAQRALRAVSQSSESSASVSASVSASTSTVSTSTSATSAASGSTSTARPGRAAARCASM